MAAVSDSEAVFLERAERAGLTTAEITILVNQGANTMARLAFAFGQPGDTLTDQQLRVLLAGPGDPAAITVGSMSSLRRLTFESHTLLVSEVKSLVENKEDEAKQELASAERTDRLKRQRTRLSGLALTGDLECGHVCYDLVFRMMQQNTIVYLPPHKFISRKMELSAEKTPKQLVVDSASNLTIRDKEMNMTCDTGTDLLLRDALTRRALAMDLIGAASFSVMEQYNRFIMSQLREQPPPGYSRVSIQQILKADREAFLRLAEKATDGIRRKANGELPLDGYLPDLESDPRVALHLLPLPNQGFGLSSKGSSIQAVGPPPKAGEAKSGKGKGKKKWKAPKNMPPALQGKQSQTKDGEPLCWNFNLPHGCSSGLAAGKNVPVDGAFVCSLIVRKPILCTNTKCSEPICLNS